MSEVEVRRCPVCGAPVAAGKPRCDFCHAPLESVHCAACFALNSADAVHCAACGEKLGLQPLDVAVALACPSCSAPLHGFGGGSGTLAECAACGGQFVEHALLADLLERREHFRSVPRALPPRQNPLAGPVRYLACPICRTRMNRNNFGGTSGIVVDTCPHHGVWFDAGELPRILEFVQAGGLERARERARLERAERERAAHVEHVEHAATLPGPWSDSPVAAAGDWRSLARDAHELFDYVLDKLGRR
ncbi:MAG TPA: zf-TFIIB domain-containing protein [Polyangiaceae bacterium]|nr:zf-TFIIB domain-containing protein [Polyangiaceae bacterium]